MSQISKYLNYLIIIGLLVVGGIFYARDNPSLLENKLTTQSEKPEIDVDQVVNKYLKQTAQQSLKERIESQRALREQLTKPMPIKKPKDEVRPEDIPAERQIWKESQVQHTPSEAIQAELYQREAESRQDEIDKKEYARQFIENARRQGYHLELSPDLEVIRVTPIRKPSQYDSHQSYPTE